MIDRTEEMWKKNSLDAPNRLTYSTRVGLDVQSGSHLFSDFSNEFHMEN